MHSSLYNPPETDWLTRQSRQRKIKTNVSNEISRQRRPGNAELGAGWMWGTEMNGLIDRSLNTANKDRWRERWRMGRKMPECCLRLSTITLMNRREDPDTCLYGTWWIHICEVAYVCLPFLPLCCTLLTQQEAAVRNSERTTSVSIFTA